MQLWSQMRKYAPLAAILGYLFVYMNKGFDRLIPDLKGITIDKLQAKSENLIIAAGAAVGIYILTKIKMPAAFKAIVLLFLYVIIGYNVAYVIDPPMNKVGTSQVAFVRPAALNPYKYGGR